MQMMFMKRAAWGAVGAVAMLLAGVAQAAGVPGQGTWETTLLGRDIGGHAVAADSARAVFLYDTTLDVTWLRDANVRGQASRWGDAYDWANALTVGAYSDWRLPSALNQDGSDPCTGYGCTGSEMGHLWYVTLGNSAGTLTNSGSFQNLGTDEYYWFGTVWKRFDDADPLDAYFFTQDAGWQGIYDMSSYGYAMAVRSGDVAAVPEPQAYAMLLVGLGSVMLAVRRRPR